MPQIRQKEFSCFECQHYAPDDTLTNQGYCTRFAMRGQDSVGTATPGGRNAFLAQPGLIWCGDFVRLTGDPRPCGPPPPPEVARLAEVNERIAELEATIAAAIAAEQEPSSEDQNELNTLQDEREDLWEALGIQGGE